MTGASLDHLRCSSCGAQLPVDTFDRRVVVIHCSHCGGEFTRSPDGGRRASSPRPEGVHETRTRSCLTMQLGVRRDAKTLFAIAFPVVGFLVLCVAFLGASAGPAAARWVGLALLSVAFAAVVATPWLVAFGVLNRTRIELTETALRVSRHPIPLPPGMDVAASSIEQLFVSSVTEYWKGGARTTSYALNLVDRDGRSRRLCAGGILLEEALYLEQEIELALGLRDRAVSQEVRA